MALSGLPIHGRNGLQAVGDLQREVARGSSGIELCFHSDDDFSNLCDGQTDVWDPGGCPRILDVVRASIGVDTPQVCLGLIAGRVLSSLDLLGDERNTWPAKGHYLGSLRCTLGQRGPH